MAMTLNITPQQELLRATVGGMFALDDAKANFLQILEAVGQHQSRKVLFDGSAVLGEPTAIERFEYGMFVAQQAATLRSKLPYRPQFAYVMKPPVLDRSRLGEMTAANRGMHVKAFDNVDDALKWLGVS